MGRYPNPKLNAGTHFVAIKTALKIEQKCENTKNCQYFENGAKYRKIPKTSSLDAALGVLQVMIVVFF